MKFFSGKSRLSILSIIVVTLFLLIATSSSTLALGKTHHHERQMSAHMQSMLEVKEGVPEAYRIMERTPIIPDAESLQQGGKLFLENCSVCHGEKGDGKGPAAAAMKPQPADFLNKKHSTIYGPGEKFWIIGHGSGKTGMPAFSQLIPVDRWHLVNYILHLQQKQEEK